MIPNDTIAAVATPPGRGAIGMVRLSGPSAVGVAGRIFAGADLGSVAERGVAYGTIVDPATGEELDEVLVTVLLPPRTYTREPMVEIGCHGGPVVVARVLRAALDAGARPAEPGEFTLRAFLSGRIDLARAEAVADLVGAESEAAARIAYRQLAGGLSAAVARWREALVELGASLEAVIEFADEGVPPVDRPAAASRSRMLAMELRHAAASHRLGGMVRDGARVTIAGRPNVGKSSLVNALAGEARVIVGPDPGTTRDTIEVRRDLRGIPVTLVDTAGIREASDGIEAEGVLRAEAAVADADLVLLVVDGAAPHDPHGEALAGGRPHLVVRNKADLPGFMAGGGEVVDGRLGEHEVSARTGRGIPALAEGIADALGARAVAEGGGIIVTCERHRLALEVAAAALERAADGLGGGATEELPAHDLRSAASALGEILGIDLGGEALGAVFSRFCIGK